MKRETGIFEHIKALTAPNMGLERNGFMAIESDNIRGLTYALKDGTVAVVTGRNGILTFDLEMADSFLDELTEVVEEFREYKGRDIKTSLEYMKFKEVASG